MEAKKPFHEVVAEGLIEQLKQGTAPWVKPWKAGDGGGFMPFNPTTGKRYKGINAIHLMAQGRTDQRWLTYKQAAAAGAQVRKGEKSTPIQYWKFEEEQTKRDENNKPVLDGNGNPVKVRVRLERPKMFMANVFNAEQIDGLPEYQRPVQTWNALDRAEQILAASGADIRHGGDRAYYSPSLDHIQMPNREQFPTADNYYATALHELGHWTGHPSRLDRDLSNPFGSEGYAKEELRAEIASMILGDELGIGHDPGHHVSYVASWIKVLQNDPLEVFRAAADAEKIQGFVLGLEQEQIQAQTVERQPVATAVEQHEKAITAATISQAEPVTAAIEQAPSAQPVPEQVNNMQERHAGFEDWEREVAVRLVQQGVPLSDVGDELQDLPWLKERYEAGALADVTADEYLHLLRNVGLDEDQPLITSESERAAGVQILRGLRPSVEAEEWSLKAIERHDLDQVVRRMSGEQLETFDQVLGYMAELSNANEFWTRRPETMDAMFNNVDQVEENIRRAQGIVGDEWARKRDVAERVQDQAESVSVAPAPRVELSQDEQMVATALRNVRSEPDLVLKESFGRLLETTSAQALGFELPGNWSGETQVTGIATDADGVGVHMTEGNETPEFFGLYARNEQGLAVWLADYETEAQALGQAARLAAIDSHAAVIPDVQFTPNQDLLAEQIQGLEAREAEIQKTLKGYYDAYDADGAAVYQAESGLDDLRETLQGLREQLASAPVAQAPRPQAPLPAVAEKLVDRTYINVPFKEKGEARELGAKWDRQKRSWYIPEGVDQANFTKWLKSEAKVAEAEPSPISEALEDRVQAPMTPESVASHVLRSIRAPGFAEPGMEHELLSMAEKELSRVVSEALGSEVWLPARWTGEVGIVGEQFREGVLEPAGETNADVFTVFVEDHDGSKVFLDEFLSKDQAEEFASKLQSIHANARPLDRTYIDVPFTEKAEAKELGAKWDQQQKSWFIPEGVDLTAFTKWLTPASNVVGADASQASAEATQAVKVPKSEREYLAVPYGEREAARAAGAAWDKGNKSWYVGPNADTALLARWKPENVKNEQEPAMDVRDEFADAMRAVGLVVRGDHPIMDGKRHRVPVEGGKKGAKDGFYVAYTDGHPAGAIINNKTQVSIKWKSKGYTLSDEQKAAMQAEAAQKLQVRESELLKTHERVAEKVSSSMADLVPIVDPTPYLVSKGIQPTPGVLTDKSFKQTVIPAMDATGKVWTAQYIQKDGTKRFAKDGRKEGCFHPLGGLEAIAAAPVLVVAEGYATARSLAAVLEFGTVAAFDSGNLGAVVQALHEKFPEKPVIVAGDDDAHLLFTLGNNVGRAKAQEAAKSVGGKAIFPTFAPGEVVYPSDLPAVTPQAYRAHVGAVQAFKDMISEEGAAAEKTVRATELKAAMLSDAQLTALNKMKRLTDFNDLQTKSTLGQDGLLRQVKSAVAKVIEDHQVQKQVQQQKQTQALGADEAQPRRTISR